jgi:beta-aspartyl-peptidase (threonine type)
LNATHAWRALALSAALLASPPALADWAADEAEIRRRLADSALAFNSGDLPGHLAVYDGSVTFMTKDGPRPGVEPIEKAFRETYFRDGKAIQALRFESLAVRRLTPDAALATARWVLSGGDKPEQSGWFTLAWLRTPAGWRVVHDHSS